ncbi:MAG: hypothetical protein QM639_01165 [Rhodocyclaceae bacterium]
MALGHLWAGRAYGTNTGNLFVKLEGNDEALSGVLHMSEAGVGLVMYSLQGAFDGNRLTLTGETQAQIEGVVFGQLTASATLTNKGELSGEWSTSIGSAGTFILFPHDQAQGIEDIPNRVPDQLHTARHSFGAVEIDREQLTAIADEIQRDFKNAQVVVTVVAGTEQSRFLVDFKAIPFHDGVRTAIIKLFVQEPEGSGVNRVALVEFGPQVNMVMTQGGDEAWVLGMLEKLKRTIRPLERTYATNFKKLGFGVNQLLVVGTITFLPSLDTFRNRAILMAGVLALVLGVNWLHGRYLPFAAIHLGPKPTGLLARIAPSLASWVIAVSAGIAATLLAAYLQGWIGLPASSGPLP